MVASDDLRKAKKHKNDEFYTMITDIEKEMLNYKDHFYGKTVYCNCDDPKHSAFWKYFHLNFRKLGLKRLISTHYAENSYVMMYAGGNDSNIESGAKLILHSNGDFRSQECKNILKEADIVVTNPPFSLFREYISCIMEYNKEFLVLGNMNALTYKEIFRLFKKNKMWYGASIHSGDRKFFVPEEYPLNASGCGIDDEGRRFIKVKGVRWFTNIDYIKRHEKLELSSTYNTTFYPKYDNYDAINVNKTKEIPVDYYGFIGVPITFMDFYCADQFEIIGISGELANPIMIDGHKKTGRFYLNGKRLYDRIVIKRKG